jgi:hypothetical protein
VKNPKFKIGDHILVEKTPKIDSSWPSETVEIFKRIIGNSFEIRGFNQIGLAEIWATKNGSPAQTCRDHSLWIETDCVKLVAKK